SEACDGQILVTEDMIGVFGDKVPKFVERFGDVAGETRAAVNAYADAVRQRSFPGHHNLFKLNRQREIAR
ncbi:MAG TPA: 3-methyl-2-oxobutanoate hydroxymethyltransferase, partial [Alphaproteobacteria bacterium]|nr:3-methyl-2-oxobutanoate hydroxymethyltransferase [Alphaproteobacteria bacterium]